MTRAYRLFAIVVFGLIPYSVLFGWSKSLHITPKSVNIEVRLIARENPLPIGSLGRNRDSYIVEVVQQGERQLARLSFRFLYYEATIPEELFDYRFTHKFRAVRDRSCDAAISSLDVLAISPNAPALHRGDDRQLPCYVVTPKNYNGSRLK